MVLVTELLCAADLAVVRDIVYTSNGEPFQGTVRLTPEGFQASEQPPTLTLRVDDGMLSVRIVPNSSVESTYSVTFTSSQGISPWTETWHVPASNRLSLAKVRLSGASGTSRDLSLPIPLSSITNLSAELAQISNSLAGLGLTIATLSSAVQNLQISSSWIVGEVPSGIITGSNAVFTLANVPAPSTMRLFRNGQRQTPGIDFNLAGKTITFAGASVPSVGDLLSANYSIATSSQPSPSVSAKDVSLPLPISDVTGLSTSLSSINNSVTGLTNTVTALSASITTLSGIVTVSGETPAGTINGTNASFTLASSPLNGEVSVYRNGLRQASGIDFNLSGHIVVFVAGAVPQSGDILLADYQHQ